MLKILNQIHTPVTSVCDIGCGTGRTAIEMARRGFEVYAVDQSIAMCIETSKNAARAKCDVKVFAADAISLRLPNTMDLILSEFYPLNYLRKRGDLARLMHCVASLLNPSGHFYFDLAEQRSLEGIHGSKHTWTHSTFRLTQTGTYSHSKRRALLNLEWKLPGETNVLKESQKLIWWRQEQVLAAISRAGLRPVQTWDGSEIRSKEIRPGFETHYLVAKQ